VEFFPLASNPVSLVLRISGRSQQADTAANAHPPVRKRTVRECVILSVP
jgi:hypothetical protein